MTTGSRSRARSFGSAAARYAAHRPSYPAALFDTVEELAGFPLAGARVADVGAGTGIASALLHARGARVVAVEPGEGMAAEFSRRNPGIALVRGDGDRLPLVTAGLDLLAYAQSWHWTDPALAGPEALRVLRPGGALAVWSNDPDTDVEWIAAQQARIEKRFGPGWYVNEPARSLPGLEFTTRRLRWSRLIPVEAHLAKLSTHSLFLVGEPGTDAFLADERDRLGALFPDGLLREHYTVRLGVALRRQGPDGTAKRPRSP
ncbi:MULTISPECIES: class I SAM-dependent methyltransferase [Streptomyces]|uniref:class I SAM-dependent methyltransferase n=1 Tax=Streptomyces TaxID=1883 RepID=UPI000F7920B4|nr:MULTISPECIES: class I SAM-dependent methyltransferase [Streptomyces]RST04849.1 class I SAM-dependent methyltransferase [Streptomyces sp. WAC07149]GLX22044.1 methyltransferase [Streptomyces lavendulae subsp. lavendulae]GLX29752.1 methyltransferase [Streptomyces lavendulae subsp. lavendulae]